MKLRGDKRGGVSGTAEQLTPAEFRERVVEPAVRRRDELAADVAAAEGELTETLTGVDYDDAAAEAAEERLIGLRRELGRMEWRVEHVTVQANSLRPHGQTGPISYDFQAMLERTGEERNVSRSPGRAFSEGQRPKDYGCTACYGNNAECAYCGGRAYRRRRGKD